MKTFHEEYGYLKKNLTTGEVDTMSEYPVSKRYTENNPLIEGYAWVRVKRSYTEVEEG
ncbi:conserved hypothetical protein [Vibrio phage 496E54-1]|nr:conserved hypothetical protein [Vibrio phage 495E54-1]CAH9013341.1 conserved hypothetical protein [Vibrio phage 496E54-1]